MVIDEELVPGGSLKNVEFGWDMPIFYFGSTEYTANSTGYLPPWLLNYSDRHSEFPEQWFSWHFGKFKTNEKRELVTGVVDFGSDDTDGVFGPGYSPMSDSADVDDLHWRLDYSAYYSGPKGAWTVYFEPETVSAVPLPPALLPFLAGLMLIGSGSVLRTRRAQG